MRQIVNPLETEENHKVLCPAGFHDSQTSGGCTFLEGYFRRKKFHTVEAYTARAC